MRVANSSKSCVLTGFLDTQRLKLITAIRFKRNLKLARTIWRCQIVESDDDKSYTKKKWHNELDLFLSQVFKSKVNHCAKRNLNEELSCQSFQRTARTKVKWTSFPAHWMAFKCHDFEKWHSELDLFLSQVFKSKVNYCEDSIKTRSWPFQYGRQISIQRASIVLMRKRARKCLYKQMKIFLRPWNDSATVRHRSAPGGTRGGKKVASLLFSSRHCDADDADDHHGAVEARLTDA